MERSRLGPPLIIVGTFLLAGFASGCGSSSPANPCTVTLSPSSDDQSKVQGALLAAKPGDVICLGAGHYHFTDELSIGVANVTLRGVGSPVLDFSAQQGGANAISVTANGVLIDSLEVDDPAGDGLRATMVDGITMRNDVVKWTRGPNTANGGYGFYPVQANHVLVEGCTASGATDTGIYIGQSKNIVVRNNVVSENMSGIEIENSTDAEVYGNKACGNVGGILVFDLPALPVEPAQGTGHAKVHDNESCMNNLMPFAPPGNEVDLVPQGTGILVLASDNNEIANNNIHDNESVGISVVSWAVALMSANDPTYDQIPDGNFIHDNKLANNGTSPQGMAALVAQDILKTPTIPNLTWDGVTDPTQTGPQFINCFSNNNATDFANFDLAGGGAKASTDIGPYTCTYPPLPSIDPSKFPGGGK